VGTGGAGKCGRMRLGRGKEKKEKEKNIAKINNMFYISLSLYHS
jgi:hypothetical protein